MEREKNIFSFAPELRTIETKVSALPIKTGEGWDTISFKQEVITGWEMPVVREDSNGKG